MQKRGLPLLLVLPLLFSCSGGNYEYEEVGNDGGANYEIFIRSFYDSNGDGIGDINGVTQKLPYLSELGISNIWLMPFNESSSYHGYDVVDYYSIEKDYGTLDDMKNLIKEAKKYNIGIIMDLVINHCSSSNQWFTQSYKDYSEGYYGTDSKANWFNWAENSRQGYNQYRNSGIYYESRFDRGMPDFNLDDGGVRNEIEKISKFWIDLGISGFRLDAVCYYYNEDSQNIEFLTWFNDMVKDYSSDFYIVGEAWTEFSSLQNYYDSGVDSFFNFNSALGGYNSKANIIPAVKTFTKAKYFGNSLQSMEDSIKEKNPNALSSYFLSNHDMDRASKSFSGNTEKDANLAKLTASVTYLLPGTPYIYYGEEIGLKGVRGENDGSDAKRRLPLIWSKDDKTGQCEFPEKNRKDLDNTVQVELGIEDQLKTGYSLLNHYKKVLNIRNKYPFFKTGRYTNLSNDISDQDEYIFAYKIVDGDKKIGVIHNFNDEAKTIDVSSLFKGVLDSIDTVKVSPKFDGGKLTLAQYSTAIMELN